MSEIMVYKSGTDEKTEGPEKNRVSGSWAINSFLKTHRNVPVLVALRYPTIMEQTPVLLCAGTARPQYFDDRSEKVMTVRSFTTAFK